MIRHLLALFSSPTRASSESIHAHVEASRDSDIAILTIQVKANQATVAAMEKALRAQAYQMLAEASNQSLLQPQANRAWTATELVESVLAMGGEGPKAAPTPYSPTPADLQPSAA
jgi:hypothetical protein